MNNILTNTPLLILAGGKASRLKNLAENTPKYLMPVSPNQVFADIHLEWVKTQGFNKVILSVGHLAKAVEDYCKDGSRWGLEINYVHDGDTPLGTGGAVALSLTQKFEYLAMTYGDTLLSLDARQLFQEIQQHNSEKASSQAEGLMTLYPLDIRGHQANAAADGPYTRYSKKKPDPSWNLIDYGFLFLHRRLIESFPAHRPLDLADPLETFCSQNQILAHVCSERFWEIGSPESLQEFQQRFSKR